MDTPRTKSSLATWLPLTALAALFALLVWKFAWSCDDSFISLRYARNLARGHGLVYNPGESPRVEGYTNLLWVLYLAPFEALGANVPALARWTSAACGVALVFVVGQTLLARLSGDVRTTALALLALVTLPPLAAWSTSGLETMPFTLALFGAFAALGGARPRASLAALAAAGAVLLRADGALLVALALGVPLVSAALRGERAVVRAAALAAAVALVVFAAHLLWRHAYYGAWQPNTARVKLEFGALTLERGLRYVATFLVSFPAALLMLAAALASPRAAREPLAIVAGIGAYAIAVGGDFMALGRFLVPALPFLALACAPTLARLGVRRAALAAGLALACAALSLASAFGVEFAPRALRARIAFRWSAERVRSEREQWLMMREQAENWSAVGRALRARSQPGESLMLGTIGAVGYHSELVIHDPFGLVNREEFAPATEEQRRSPGHQRRVPFETFLARHPTYLEAALVPAAQRLADLPARFRPGGQLAAVARIEFAEVADVPGIPRGWLLRLVRYVPPGR